MVQNNSHANSRDARTGRFTQTIGRDTLSEIVASVLIQGSRFRTVANTHHVSTAFVAKTIEEERAVSPAVARLAPSRREVLLSREQAVTQIVLRLCKHAQAHGTRISAMAFKPLVGEVAAKAKIGTVSLSAINRVLDRLAAERKIALRLKPGPAPKRPLGGFFDTIVERVRGNPTISNEQLMEKTGLTPAQFNRALRKLRSAGLLPQRNRPGSKPITRPPKKALMR